MKHALATIAAFIAMSGAAGAIAITALGGLLTVTAGLIVVAAAFTRLLRRMKSTAEDSSPSR